MMKTVTLAGLVGTGSRWNDGLIEGSGQQSD